MGLRLGKISDLMEIYQICLSIKAIYKKNNINLWNDYYPSKEDFEEDINTNQLYVYEMDGEIVGSISFEETLTDDIKEISNTIKYPGRFMVKPNLQNKGIGTLIMHELYPILKEEGIEEMRFLVSLNNPKAIKLYEKEGCINLGIYKTPWEEETHQQYYLFKKLL